MSNNVTESAPRIEVEFALTPGDNSPELYSHIVGRSSMMSIGAGSNEGYKEARLSNTIDGEPVLAIQGSRNNDEVRELSSNSEIRGVEVALLRGLGAIAQNQGITNVSAYVSSPAELDTYKEAFGDQPTRFVDGLWVEDLPITFDEAWESLDRHNQRIENGTAEEPEDAGMFIGVDISGFQPTKTDLPVNVKNEFELLNPPSWNDFYAKNYPELG